MTGLFITYSLLSFAQAGALDGDFDADGKVITTISGGDDFVSAVAMQSDDKIVVTERYVLSGGTDQALCIHFKSR